MKTCRRAELLLLSHPFLFKKKLEEKQVMDTPRLGRAN